MTAMKPLDPSDIPDDPLIRREWIKFQLAIRGYSLAGLARQHGVTRQQPQAALNRPYPKWERIIAEILQVDPDQLWPERYADARSAPQPDLPRALSNEGP